jgi:NADPH-dependent 2,4-dienoyl-CoA reductase/sulfur reductase-like enzyme
LVLLALGIEPNAELARAASIATGHQGAIRVNRCMETNVRDVFAAGDCVETWHRVLSAYSYLPLGTTAHKQGLVAGENVIGGSREFQGSVGTQVVKVFDLAIARTGLRDPEAGEAGNEPLTVECWDFHHKAYYPDAKKLCIRITGDRNTGRLLGAPEVAKRIDIVAAALFHDIQLEALIDLDLSYTPPFSSPWDPVQMAAQVWARAVRSSGT